MEKNIDVVNYVKDVISIRKEFNCFKLRTKDDIINRIDISFTKNNVCVYKIKTDEYGYDEVIVIINPNKMVELYSLKDNYKVVMTENGRVLEPFDVCNLIVNPCSIVVLAKEKEASI